MENRDATDWLQEKIIVLCKWYKQNKLVANRSIGIAIGLILLLKIVPFKTGNPAATQMAINPQPVAPGSQIDQEATASSRLVYTQTEEETAKNQYRATLLANVEDYLSYRGNQFKLHIENIRKENNLSDYTQAAQLAQKEQADRLTKLKKRCNTVKSSDKQQCQSKVDAEIGSALTELLALQLVIDKQLDVGQLQLQDQTAISFDPSNLVVDNERVREATANRVAANDSYKDAVAANIRGGQ